MMLPPFRGAVRQIIIFSAVIYVVILLLMSFAPPMGQAVLALGVLEPARIAQGWLWQFVTYTFMYIDPLDFVLSLLGIYFLGVSVEERVGTAAFYGLFFSSVIISAIAGFLLSLTGVIAHGQALGCGAAVNAILMVFYLFNRGAPLMLFPLPIQIPAKWIVWGTAGIETAYLLLNHFALFYCVLLLGLGAGSVWYYAWYGAHAVKRPSMRLSERLYGVRNAYYRWRRRQAAKKFEVYMRKHDRDVHFDEHGNYIPPDDDPRKGNGGSKSGWVN